MIFRKHKKSQRKRYSLYSFDRTLLTKVKLYSISKGVPLWKGFEELVKDGLNHAEFKPKTYK